MAGWSCSPPRGYPFPAPFWRSATPTAAIASPSERGGLSMNGMSTVPRTIAPSVWAISHTSSINLPRCWGSSACGSAELKAFYKTTRRGNTYYEHSSGSAAHVYCLRLRTGANQCRFEIGFPQSAAFGKTVGLLDVHGREHDAGRHGCRPGRDEDGGHRRRYFHGR